mgnify:CR=1 FL=1
MSQVTENKVISAPVPMTPLQEFWHYFKRNKGAVVGLVYVVIVLFIAIFANWIAPYNPAEQFRDALLAPPAWQEGGSGGGVFFTGGVDPGLGGSNQLCNSAPQPSPAGGGAWSSHSRLPAGQRRRT